MTIALIRHGETDWNKHLRLQGSSDIPLNDTGREQARNAAERLASRRWDAVVSSPLSRARETARIIADTLGVELGPSYDLLTERHYGAAEGATAEIIEERWPDRQYPGLEPIDTVVARATSALAQVAEEYRDSAIVVVCHGTLIRHTLQHLSGRTFEQIFNGAISTISRTDEGWRVLSVNGEELDVITSMT